MGIVHTKILGALVFYYVNRAIKPDVTELIRKLKRT